MDNRKENKESNQINHFLESTENLSLDNLNNYIQRLFPEMEGTGYKLTNDNLLSSSFLLQTPNIWGKNANSIPLKAGIDVAENIQKIISSAEQFIDITTLAPFPDGLFMEAIQNGLRALIGKNRNITVRILAGWPPTPFEGDNQYEYLLKLIEPIKLYARNISIYVGVQRNTLVDTTWNHAKIIAVDGKYAIVGGENLWNANYLGPYPVHDLNVSIEGSSVYYMHKFIDPIWQKMCSYFEESWKPVSWDFVNGVSKRCLIKSDVKEIKSGGNTKILGAGRYGTYDSTLKPADSAILYCMNTAKESLYIAQQDLLNQLMPWKEGMEALANAIIRGVNVKIVISNDNGKASATEDPSSPKSDSYSTSTQEHTFEELKIAVELSAYQQGKKVLGKFELAVLRFSNSSEWTNGWQFANHSKFFMVDEKIACIGSENLYPANLIEYVVFIDDDLSVGNIMQNYWKKLWRYSSVTVMTYPNTQI